MRTGLWVLQVAMLGASLRVACGQEAVAGGADAALGRRIVAMTREPAVLGAHWGVVVEGLDGAPVVEIGAEKLFQPASNNKLLTTAAAMALLGPSATVSTRLEAAGDVTGDGVLTGDLRLEGGGDASFGTDDVPYVEPTVVKARRAAEAVAGSTVAAAKAEREAHPLREVEQMAEAVVAAGIKTVQGDVVGTDVRWAWEPYPEAWSVDDLVWGYGAPVGALAVHDNQMEVRVRPGAAAGAPGEVVMEAGLPDWYTVDAAGLRTGAAKSGTAVAMDRAVGSRVLRVWGTIAVDAPDKVEEVAIDDPAEFAARALKQALAARGVEVRGVARAEHRLPMGTMGFQAQVKQAMELPAGGVPGESGAAQPAGGRGGRLLLAVESPALLPDETATNKDSLNLHAEMLLERLSERFGAGAGTAGVDAGSRAQGVRVVRTFLVDRVGVAPGDVALLDGSGLSTHDLVTPRALARLLVWAAGQPWGAAWRTTLPVAGVDGSLAGRFVKGADGRGVSPVTGRLEAKTGTLGEARALSGYLRCASGRTVVVSVMVDGHLPGGVEPTGPNGGPADREVMDRIVEAVYRAE